MVFCNVRQKTETELNAVTAVATVHSIAPGYHRAIAEDSCKSSVRGLDLLDVLQPILNGA